MTYLHTSPCCYLCKCCELHVVLQGFKLVLLQGTHKSLKDNQKAKATVAAIIDGTGSLGEIYGRQHVHAFIYMQKSVLCRTEDLALMGSAAAIFREISTLPIIIVQHTYVSTCIRAVFE